MLAGQINILYNNQDAFYPYPTPYVGMEYSDIFYAGFWSKLETIILNGQITGCTYEGLISGSQQLLNNFNKSFQTLQIFENDTGISGLVFSRNFVEIVSVNFGQSQKWVGVLPYTVTLRSYPSNYFSGQFGVIDPVDSWSFQVSEDYVMNISHNIGCRGVNTNSSFSNALDNARNWVTGRTGFKYDVLPIFIETGNIGNLCLITQQEQIDRINGVYSVAQNYINDTTRTGYGVLRYSTTFESGNDAISAKIQGSVQGCGQDMQNTRLVLSGFDTYGAASISYNKIFNLNDLNPIPLTYSINEDPYVTKIDFIYEYDSNNLPPVYLDYSVNIASGTYINAGIQGQIIARGGDVLSKLQRATSFAQATNLYSYVVPLYNQFYPLSTGYPLNPVPTTSGYVINENLGQITLSAEFNNFQQPSSGLDFFNYTLAITPATEKLNVEAILNGNTQSDNYSIVDLNYKNRAILAVNGRSKISDTLDSISGLNLIKSNITSLFLKYGTLQNAVIDKENFNFSREDQRVVDFSVSYSFESSDNAVLIGNYGQIDNLNV